MPESRQHEEAKRRIRDIARRKGRIAENEIPFWCWSCFHSKTVCYSADIFLFKFDWTPAIIEIDGYRGHRSEYQSRRDIRRTEDIKAVWGDDIMVHRYTIEELKILTDKEIQKDLGI